MIHSIAEVRKRISSENEDKIKDAVNSWHIIGH